MKQIIIASGCVLTAGACMFNLHSVEGNGVIASQEQKVEDFYGICLESFADVQVHKSDECKVIVKTDSNILQYVDVTVKNGKLIIDMKNDFNSYKCTYMVVDVYTNKLESLQILGSGKIKLIDKFTTSAFEVEIEGSGDIIGEIETDELRGSIAGSGDIKLSGKANETNFTISGSGDIDCVNMISNKANAEILGSGDIRLCVTEVLDASITGSGSVKYKGNPQVNKDILGSEKVRNIQ